MIKSTLSNLPTYFLPLFSVLVGVANRIEKILWDSLWGGVDNEVKFHLVSCSKVCTLIYSRELGVRNLILFDVRSLKEMAMALQHRRFVEIGGGS